MAQHDLFQGLLRELLPLVRQDVLVHAEGSLHVHAGSRTILEHGHVSRAHALGKGAGSPRDHSCNCLDAFKPRVLLQHVVQLDLQLLTDLAIAVLLHVLEWVILPTIELTEPLQSSLQRHCPWLTKNKSTLTPANFTSVICPQNYFFFVIFTLCGLWPEQK